MNGNAESINALDDADFTVLDLPQLYNKPSSKILLLTLSLLAIKPPSWEISHDRGDHSQEHSDPAGLARYLTSIISSRLSWITDESAREAIWEAASARLSERSGRTAMPHMQRTFRIPLNDSDTVDITLHEPSLTSDNLGLKTWASSYLLAKRLKDFHLPTVSQQTRCRVLELGAGTGLVGIAAAAVLGADVHLTDLAEIVENLSGNVRANEDVISRCGGYATTGALNWELAEEPESDEGRFQVIVSADPLYSPRHPGLLTTTIKKWLSKNEAARVIVELPLREAYLQEVHEFRKMMTEFDFQLADEGHETGYDDWGTGGGRSAEVHCWWGIWKWKWVK